MDESWVHARMHRDFEGVAKENEKAVGEMRALADSFEREVAEEGELEPSARAVARRAQLLRLLLALCLILLSFSGPRASACACRTGFDLCARLACACSSCMLFGHCLAPCPVEALQCEQTGLQMGKGCLLRPATAVCLQLGLMIWLQEKACGCVRAQGGQDGREEAPGRAAEPAHERQHRADAGHHAGHPRVLRSLFPCLPWRLQ